MLKIMSGLPIVQPATNSRGGGRSLSSPRGVPCSIQASSVFRSSGGRYLVHAIRKPVQEWDCKIPKDPDDDEEW